MKAKIKVVIRLGNLKEPYTDPEVLMNKLEQAFEGPFGKAMWKLGDYESKVFKQVVVK
jgi:hypothetical protein